MPEMEVITIGDKRYLIGSIRQMPEREKMKPVRVMMPPELVKTASIVAAAEGRSRSALIRDAVREYLDKRGHSTRPEYELPADAIEGDDFTLGELAEQVSEGNLEAMAMLLNRVGADPQLDESELDASAHVERRTVIALHERRLWGPMHETDEVREILHELLIETARD